MAENNTKNILDIGCGKDKVKGAIGVDLVDEPEVDVVHDLNIFPYPFKSESFDEIYMLDAIEHLNDTIKVMGECHRLLKPNGKLFIRVVYWNHKYSWSDPTHVRAFSEVSFNFFVGQRAYYTDFTFKDLQIDYIYDGIALKIFRIKKLVKFLSRFLCNMIQGMEISLTK